MHRSIPDSIDELRAQLASSDDPDERLALLERLWSRLDDTSLHSQALEVAREAHAIARSLGDPLRAADAARSMGTSACHAGRLDEGGRHLRSAYRTFVTAGRELDAARCMYALGSREFIQGNLDAARKRYERALEVFRRLDERLWTGKTLANLAVVEWHLHRSVEAIPVYEEAIALMLAEGQESEAAWPLTNLIGAEITHGRYGSALRRALRTGAILEAYGLVALRVRMLGMIGTMHGRLGDHTRAIATLREAEELARDVDSPMTRIDALKSLGAQLSLAGEHAEAIEVFETAIALARSSGTQITLVPMLIQLAKIELELNNPGRAREVIAEIDELRPAIDSPDTLADATYLVGLMRRHEGDRAAALVELEQALRVARPTVDPRLLELIHSTLSEIHQELGEYREALEHHRRLLELREQQAGADRQREVAAELMRQQVEEFERERAELQRQADALRLELERKRSDLAAMAVTVVQKNEALDRVKTEVSKVVGEVIGEARPMLRRIVGSIERTIASESDWRAFEARFTEMNPGFMETLRERFPMLTVSELRVCALLRLDLSTKEMAEILSVSTRAIEKHRLNIRRKLDAPKERPLTEYLRSLAVVVAKS